MFNFSLPCMFLLSALKKSAHTEQSTSEELMSKQERISELEDEVNKASVRASSCEKAMSEMKEKLDLLVGSSKTEAEQAQKM